MQLRIYDAELKFLGITENQTSVIWTRKYFEPGEFQVELPITDDNLSLFQLGNIVSKRDSIEAGVIEDLRLHESISAKVIIASGRFLSSYMDRRLIRPKYNFSGRIEVAMRTILDNAADIPLVELGELQGFTEEITFQATYKNLLSYQTKLAKAGGMGYRFRPDFTTKKIYFEVYKGLDRTREQSDRAFVEFSDRFDNMNDIDARFNDKLYKNVGYVGGQGEGDDRIYVTVGDDASTGLERREVFISATDITRDEGMSEVTYRQKLAERGNEKLKECVFSNAVECVTIPMGNFEYKRDYDLGDIVTVRKTNWNYENQQRITEISEVYEHGIAQIVPVLGTAIPEKIEWEDK